ncbi:hypothetical protein IGI04_012169, partial [Brassica rapa subsp. trilocularis]
EVDLHSHLTTITLPLSHDIDDEYEWIVELLSWIQVPNSKRLSLLRKLATQTVVFHLWKQRNNLIHNQISFPAIAVFRSIDKELRNVISARRKYKKFRDLMAIWLR